ncbi:MAG: indolepyruvate ferredoxin oxidoreductase family protein, partial [Burkholderiales bacterium]
TWLLPAHYEHNPAIVARAIAQRLTRMNMISSLGTRFKERLAFLDAKEKALARPRVTSVRQPYFCSGCPHNTSTRVPEGSRATAGIGCHFMAVWMDRNTSTFTHMGAEGAPWIGQAPFTEEKHIFANLGDGTYYHSGLMAIRAAVAAKVTMTYKILYNDAVAMTGGQPIDGTLTVPQIVAQLDAEGARKVVVVTDEPDKYDAVKGRSAMGSVAIHHRDHLDWVQRELRDTPGCTVLIYDQTCATEKRRRRKKIVDGKPGYPDPARRVVINEAVCEGCGDCSVQSSCVSVEPVETEFGRKRRINQSSCNKDFSCLKGFCPSFVTVEGGALRRPVAAAQTPAVPAAAAAGAPDADPCADELPEAVPLPIDASGNRSYGVLVTGVGGTGVITVGQLLGMAAHLEGKGVSVLDMAGLAQKGGAVFSHVQIARAPEHLFATRIATGEADLVIGCDLVVTAGNEALAKMRADVTRAVVNTDVMPTSDFLRDPDWRLPAQQLRRNILDAAGAREIDFVEANTVAEALLGDAIYTNPLLVGYAWQKGWLPLARRAIERAIELNGVQAQANRRAFDWGRRLAHDPDGVRRLVAPAQPVRVVEFRRRDGGAAAQAPANPAAIAAALDALIERREQVLVAYQDRGYADRYRRLVERVREAERERIGVDGSFGLTEAVARYAFKLMAYKDEYEVARLHADPAFQAGIASRFEGDWKLKFHLAPPLLSRVDPKTGRPRKIAFGPWMMTGFRVLARLKFLRGTAFDPFGRTEERRTERALVGGYEKLVDEIVPRLNTGNYALAVELASVPEHIRGFGPVKQRHLQDARLHQAHLLAQFRGEPATAHASIQAGAPRAA